MLDKLDDHSLSEQRALGYWPEVSRAERLEAPLLRRPQLSVRTLCLHYVGELSRRFHLHHLQCAVTNALKVALRLAQPAAWKTPFPAGAAPSPPIYDKKMSKASFCGSKRPYENSTLVAPQSGKER
ncbi:uncharacterized protein [Dermacentor albipictus]|uniref:uncharacterized protein n=1 Tax=Dermacentor albipictus TaxID=60249 RepID=UPI0038FD1CC9